MKTSELIAALAATDSQPVHPAGAARSLAPAALAGTAVAAATLALWLGFQPLAPALLASWFWMKAGYSLALALAGFLVLGRLARPGAKLGAAGLLVGGLAIGAMIMLATQASMHAPADHRLALWLGDTWRMCSMRIVALAVPVYVALIFGLRRLAPTRLTWAGGAAGLVAGGLAAAVYGLYCQESTSPFVVAWYSAGMAASALIGAMLGPRLLRW